MTDQPEARSDTSKGKPGPLEQPPDALKMADLSKPSADPEAPTSSAQPSDAQPSATNPQPGAAEEPSNTDSTPPRLAGSTSDKGKGPEEGPAPPTKNDEPKDTAIGEASDEVSKAGPSASKGEGLPVCVITLLVPSGKKHPYKIDEKYLAKRNVNIPGTTASGHKDPLSISAYTLKELILREWREDWEPPPPSPTSIRLIHFGHLLEDKKSLTGEFGFFRDSQNLAFVPYANASVRIQIQHRQ